MKSLIAILFFMIGLAGIAHHYIVCGRLFDWSTLRYHEPLIVLCFILAVVVKWR